MKILFTLIVFNLVGCATTSRFDRAIAHQQCDQAATLVPQQKDPGLKFIGRTQQVGGILLSYSYTGAAYTAEVLWDALGGTVMFVGLCGPSLAVTAFATTNSAPGTLPLGCFPGKLNALGAPKIGKRAFASTKDLRCPPVTPLSQNLRQVALCYRTEKTEAGFSKSKQILQALHDSGEFYNCLSTDEQKAIETDLETQR